MRIALCALVLAGCAAQAPYSDQPPPYIPYQFTPYMLPPPYQMPTNRPPAPQVNCITTSRPGLGGPQLITTCN